MVWEMWDVEIPVTRKLNALWKQLDKLWPAGCFHSSLSCSLEGPPPSSQINTHTESYSFLWMPNLSLTCFLPAFLNLNFPSIFCFWAFPFLFFCISLLAFLFHVWLCGWLSASSSSLLLPSSPSSVLALQSCLPRFFLLFILSACQPCLSFLLSRYWLFSSLLGQSGVLSRQSNTASQS